MTLPRISVGAIMAGLVVIALDLVVYRSIRSRPTDVDLSMILLASLPMANILFVGIASLARGRGWSRPFLVGFELGGWCAIVIAVAWMEPGMRLLADAFQAVGLTTWLEASPVREALASFAFGVGLPLSFQLLAALAGAWIARRLADERGPASVDASSSGRQSLRALVVLVVLVAIPAVLVEGILRWRVDSSVARLPQGSLAVVNMVDPFGLPGGLAPGSPLRLLDGEKVQVEQDSDPHQLEISKDVMIHIRDLRPVRVKLLEGPQAGESLDLLYYMLRPIR